jgi:hypothetical protein
VARPAAKRGHAPLAERSEALERVRKVLTASGRRAVSIALCAKRPWLRSALVRAGRAPPDTLLTADCAKYVS